MSEADYRRVTYRLTLPVARPLAERNQDMTFVFVSGAGLDTGSRMIWACVKSRASPSCLHRLFCLRLYQRLLCTFQGTDSGGSAVAAWLQAWIQSSKSGQVHRVNSQKHP